MSNWSVSWVLCCYQLSGLIKMCGVSLLLSLHTKSSISERFSSGLFWGVEHQTTFCDPDVIFIQHAMWGLALTPNFKNQIESSYWLSVGSDCGCIWRNLPGECRQGGDLSEYSHCVPVCALCCHQAQPFGAHQDWHGRPGTPAPQLTLRLACHLY